MTGPVVDPDKCAGHGRCLVLAPGVFELDDVDGLARVVDGGNADTAAVDRARIGCPEGAISWSGA